MQSYSNIYRKNVAYPMQNYSNMYRNNVAYPTQNYSNIYRKNLAYPTQNYSYTYRNDFVQEYAKLGEILCTPSKIIPIELPKMLTGCYKF